MDNPKMNILNAINNYFNSKGTTDHKPLYLAVFSSKDKKADFNEFFYTDKYFSVEIIDKEVSDKIAIELGFNKGEYDVNFMEICFCFLYRKRLKKISLNKKYIRILRASSYRLFQDIFFN